MIGIKGVGMTMLAQYYAGNGHIVLGSDTEEKFMTDTALAGSGIEVIEHFEASNIPADADLIIYSTAYKPERNVEVAAALSGKIRTLTYAQALAEVFNSRFGIAVCGSHGKTTTTAWLGYLIWKAGLDPSVLVGAVVPQFDAATLIGRSHYMVIEADEYQNKLQYFQPRAVLMNNIDYDHPDFFPTRDDYTQVFTEFIKKIPRKGFLVCNFDDKEVRKIARVNCRAKVIGYAIDEAADYIAYDIKIVKGEQYFKVKLGSDEMDDEGGLADLDLGEFHIRLSGRHNIYNAMAVIAAALELEIPLSAIRGSLAEFTGTARRNQIMGNFRGAVIIDDYAHHPTEISATLAGLRQQYPDNYLRIAFHPHTYTRTKGLLDEFGGCFGAADEVIVLDIYGSAREEQGGVHSKDVIDKISAFNSSNGIEQSVKYLPGFEELEKYLREKIERGDVVVLMGAGDIFRVGENLVS